MTGRPGIPGLILLGAIAVAAQAQSYPVKPIRMIMPSAPGSTTDQIFRVVSTGIGSMLGQQLVADYRAGAAACWARE
jgi:tripartite-type tricarboxylate transporter receptor subunit TctC